MYTIQLISLSNTLNTNFLDYIVGVRSMVLNCADGTNTLFAINIAVLDDIFLDLIIIKLFWKRTHRSADVA